MNEDHYRALVEPGVFPGAGRRPGAHLRRRRIPGPQGARRPRQFGALGHVREADSIPIGVWRLRHGIFTTGSQRVDLIHLADHRRAVTE